MCVLGYLKIFNFYNQIIIFCKAMDQVGKTRMIINGFILAAISISLFQQMIRKTTPDSPIRSNNENSNSNNQPDIPVGLQAGTDQYAKYISENNITISQKIPNLLIKVTDKLDSQIKTLLATEGFNVEVKPYQFQGNQWYLNIFLNYGHMIIMWFMMSKYKAEQNQSKKKKMIILGFVLVFGWMICSSIFKPQRITIEYENKEIYSSDTILKTDIIPKVFQYQNLYKFSDYSF